jgi:hypothetical protein
MNLAGYSGSILLTDTTAITTTTTGGQAIRAIQVLEDATFTTLTDTTSKTNGNTTNSVAADYGTVTAGLVLYGTFTAVTLTSGRVKLYF